MLYFFCGDFSLEQSKKDAENPETKVKITIIILAVWEVLKIKKSEPITQIKRAENTA